MANPVNYFETLKQKDAIIAEKESAIQKLTMQVAELHAGMLRLENLLREKHFDGETSAATESDSEEDLVNKETAWILKRRKKGKKRKMNSSPDESSPQKILSEVEHNSQDKQNKAQEVKQKPVPPPIIVTQVIDFKKLRETLLEKGFNFKANLLNNEEVKINADSIDAYREMSTYLSNKGYKWHTYEIKQNRPIKVMVRNLHPTCKPENIVQELSDNGFKILSAVNILRKETKEEKKGSQITRTSEKKPLPLFMLTFESNEDIKKVYAIKTLQNLVVKMEPVRSSRLVPQCKRCQRHGHTQHFCRRDAVCVKCAQKHLTATCTKDKNTAPKCANCNQAHPASYRGCEVAKEIQQRRDKMNKMNTNKINKNDQEKRPEKINNIQRKTDRTYSQIAAGPSTDNTENEPTLTQIMTTLNKILDRIEKLENATFPRSSRQK